MKEGIIKKFKPHSRLPRTEVNHSIKASKIRVIDEQGNNLGILETPQAIEVAFDRGYDLVMISKNAKPPVCKIMDYGKYKYQERRKLKEAQQKQTTIKVKELRMRPRIEEHDYEVKLDKARKFLEVGMDRTKSNSPLQNKRNKVKFLVRLVGREIAHADLGIKVLNKFIEDLSDIGEVEQPPTVQGNTISMVIAPKKTEVRHAKN